MKPSTICALACSLLIVQSVLGQITLTLNVRTPTPSQISVWERDRTVIQAVITNASGTTYTNVRPSFTIRNLDNNQIVAFSKDNDPGIPRFTIPPTTTIVRNGPDLVNADAVSIDQGIKTIVSTTNSLPEGTYEICLTLLADNRATLTSVPVCRTFVVLIPDPPTLIAPANGDSLAPNIHPTFTWIPVNAGPGVSVRYRLVIAPVYSGQTPKNALEQNQPLFNQFVPTSSFFYGPSLPQFNLFPLATGYAWQVTAMDAQGQAVTRNEGKSPVFRFSGKKTNLVVQIPPKLPQAPVLVFPEANASISSLYWSGNKPWDFEWKYPPYPKVKLRLRVVKINPGQTPSDAIAQNTSYLFEDVSSGHGSSLQWEIQEGMTRLSFPPLEGGNDYAWQVLVINQTNGATTAASEIRKFTFIGSSKYSWETSTVSGTLRYKFNERGGTGRGMDPSWPLANATVKVVIQYKLYHLKQVFPKVFRWELKLDKYGQPVTQAVPPNDYATTIGTTTTDGNGNFSLSFIQNDSTGVNRTNTTSSYPSVTTSWRRILRIELDSPETDYYTSPADDIIIQPGQTKTLGNLSARVRDYKLTVSFKADPSTAQQKIPKGELVPGMEVYLLRKVRPLGVPPNEGAPPPRNLGEAGPMMQLWFQTMEVVGKGETDANSMTFSFARCVQRHGPNDTYYLFGMSSPNTNYNYTTIGPVAFKYEDGQDKSISSDEYTYPSTSKVLTAYPLKPTVSGTVRTTETNLTLSNATVILMSSQGWMGIEKVTVTDSTGWFVFSDLPTTYNASGGLIGPSRSLFISRKGYASKTFPVGVLEPGQKLPPQDRLLEPLSTITGKITDMAGNGVSANVRVVGGESKDFDPLLIFVNFKRVPVSFDVQAPKGENTIIVDPTAFAPSLLPETLKVNITGKTLDVGVVKLKPKQYRLVVEVREKGLTWQGQGPKIIAGAEVKLKDKSGNSITYPGGLPIEGTTTSNGRIEFSFQNSSSTIFAEVVGPSNKNYVPSTGSLQPTLTSKPETLIVKLAKGSSISGHVYVGPLNTPVAGAEVALTSTSTQNLLVTTTDSSGFYVLHNVPIGSRTYIASKQQSNLVGNEKTLNVPSAGLQNIDFVLTPFTAMDISKLLGFPIAVEGLTQSGNQTKISGKFLGLKDFGNGQFSTLGTLSFSDVEIVAGSGTSVVFGQTVPVAKPKADSVITEQNSLAIKIFGKYNATLNNMQTGIAVLPDNEGMGIVRGFVHAAAGSFQATYFKVQEDEFLLSAPGLIGKQTPTITASKSDPLQIPEGLAVSDKNSHSLPFKLYDFDAVADSSASTLTADSLRLFTTIHTNVQNVTPHDINLTIGRVSFAPGMTTLGPIVPKQTVAMKMDNWTLELESVMLYGQLSATKGTLKTPTVSVPLKKMTISPTAFISNEFDLSNLSLAGIVPLIVKKDPILNYDPTITQWILGSADASGLAAVITGLPGMANGDSIALDGFLLKSKQNNPSLSPAPSQQPIKLYGLGKLTPTSIQVFQQQGYVEMSQLSFGIPKAGNVSNIIHYLKENGKVVLKVLPTPILFPGNGLTVALADTAGMPYLFDEKGLRVRGKVFETGKYSIPVWLFHTKDSTSMWVENPDMVLVNPSPSWFNLPIGATKTFLEKLVGGMKPVNANEWNNFWFAGDLAGTPGISGNKKRLTFTVVGTVKANNQELGIDNIPTPFGNMEWVFDFEHKRLHGSIPSINKELNGSARVTGTAAAVIDGSGWFFVSGGTLELDSPHFKLAAALVLGDYPNISSAQEFKDVFLVNPKKYSHDGEIPSAFTKSLSGFYFSGKAELPFPFLPPSIDIHLDPLVHVSVDYYWGGEVALGMNFSGDNVYYVESRVFLGASVDVGGSVLLACLSGHVGGEVYIYGKGEYNSGNGDWWVEGGAGLTLSGGGTVGYGCCDSDCECFLPVGECVTSSWSDTIDIGILKCRLGKGGPKFCALSLCP